MALRHVLLAVLLWAGLPAAPLWSWDFTVHKLINGHAVDLTTGPLGVNFRQHRNWLVALWLWAWEVAGKPTPPA